MKSLKHKLREICLAKIDESIASLSVAIDEARTAQKDETKSSAGDKYETTREMMTQEIEKNSAQIAKLVSDRNRLMSIAPDEANTSVQQGSVIYTNYGNFYLALSLGVVVCDGVKFQTVSTTSPIGQQMLNKRTEDKFHFHDKEYVILRIE